MARLDYLNARLRARRPALMRAEDVRELLTRPTTEARLELVARRGPPETAPRTIAAAQQSLHAALREEARRALAEIEGARARRALAAALAVDDAAVVKAALRAVLSTGPGAPGPTAERAMLVAPPSAALAEPTLHALALARTPADVVAALDAARHPIAPALREVLAAPGKALLPRLELAADAAAFRAAREGCGTGEDAAVVRRHLALRVDVRNAATLLVLGDADAAATGEGFLPGGARLDAARFRALATGPRDAALAAVSAAFRGVGPALARPWTAERALERVVIEALRREARLRPLSVAVPLLYLSERRAEIRRTCVVLRGAELALPGEELLELVEA